MNENVRLLIIIVLGGLLGGLVSRLATTIGGIIGTIIVVVFVVIVIVGIVINGTRIHKSNKELEEIINKRAVELEEIEEEMLKHD